MISVVIATLNQDRELGHSLAPLVAAAVDGLVREVVVADGGSTDATLELADDAGARIVRTAPERRLAEGCAAARSDWLLVLPAGRRMSEGWQAALSGHLGLGPGRAGYFSGGGLLASRAARRGGGLLLPRRLLAAGGGFAAGPLKLAGSDLTRLAVRLI